MRPEEKTDLPEEMIEPTLPILGENVQRFLADRGWTEKGMEAATRVASSTVGNARNAKSITLRNLHLIAEGFRVPAWALLCPDMPVDVDIKDLRRLMRAFCSADPKGRERIAAYAEFESLKERP